MSLLLLHDLYHWKAASSLFFFYKKPHRQVQHVYFVILFNFFNISISWAWIFSHLLHQLTVLNHALPHVFVIFVWIWYRNFFLMQSPHLMCFSVASVRVSRLNREKRVFIWRPVEALSLWGGLVRMLMPTYRGVLTAVSLFFQDHRKVHCAHFLGFQIRLIQATSMLGGYLALSFILVFCNKRDMAINHFFVSLVLFETHFLHPPLFWETCGFNVPYGLFSIPGSEKFLYHSF